MLNNADDLIFLKDIVDCCLRIMNTTRNSKYHYFEKNYEKKSIVERQLEIIGEATKRLTEDTRNTYSHIPWRMIVGLRNILAHEYGEVQTEKVWVCTQKHVPELLENLYKINELKEYIDSEKIKYKKLMYLIIK